MRVDIPTRDFADLDALVAINSLVPDGPHGVFFQWLCSLTGQDKEKLGKALLQLAATELIGRTPSVQQQQQEFLDSLRAQRQQQGSPRRGLKAVIEDASKLRPDLFTKKNGKPFQPDGIARSFRNRKAGTKR